MSNLDVNGLERFIEMAASKGDVRKCLVIHSVELSVAFFWGGGGRICVAATYKSSDILSTHRRRKKKKTQHQKDKCCYEA